MRFLLRLIGLLVIVAVVAVASLLLLPGDRIAHIAADRISEATGRKVNLSGQTKVTFFPVLGVSTGAVTVANADWSDGPPMFQADSLKVGVTVSALWGGDIKITGLEAARPQIYLERAKDGRVNWELGVEGVAPSGQSDGGEAGPAQSAPLALTLDRALITNASLTYKDGASGNVFQMEKMDFDLRWPDYDGVATFEAMLHPQGDAVEISGNLNKVGDFIAGKISELDFKVSAPGGEISFAGRASTAPQLAGQFDADVSDTSRFLTALSGTGVEIPRGLGRAISAQAGLTITQDMRIALRDTLLTLDNNQLTGAADVNLGGAKPKINMQLRAGALDLTGLSANNESASSSGGGSGESGNPKSSGWSKEPIEVDALGLFDGQIALTADSIDLGDFKLGNTRTMVALDRSRMVFDLRELQAYDGSITGEFVMNNRSGLSVGGKMNVAGLNLETFLSDAIDVSRLSGSANGNISFLGVGNSLYAIMNSLKGEGALSTGRGVISGFDLDKLMRSGNVTGGTTVFDSMSASFTINKGNLQNNDLLMKLPLAKAEGKGRIGLGAQDIDYLFTPILLEGEARKGFAIPVRIRGPWSNPRIKPDLEKAIDLNFKEEKKKIESKAQDEVNRLLEDELDVKAEEGESIEDAVKKGIEKEIGKELLKLFD
ncbi:putative assembly protein [Roseovarius albus]|uniref:Putative assembly protein n=1 Tax=Roseovarius albus TaxID=1247867 RepID=A0A1X7A277_9RHOB|nr:AsmA family protein [Roseovarius albus]SLN68516.1 putative assembly protein [Roseovarius albus]